MEETVPQRVGLQPGHRGGGVVARAGEQVVPLEDLVENDAVDEAPEADSQQQAGDDEAPLVGFRPAGQCFRVAIPVVYPLPRDEPAVTCDYAPSDPDSPSAMNSKTTPSPSPARLTSRKVRGARCPRASSSSSTCAG